MLFLLSYFDVMNFTGLARGKNLVIVPKMAQVAAAFCVKVQFWCLDAVSILARLSDELCHFWH